MSDAGFSPIEVVDLLAFHAVAAQDHVDETIPGTPFNSTPSSFDAQFFVEVSHLPELMTRYSDQRLQTLLRGNLFPGNGSNVGEVMSPLRGEFRLQSDSEISHGIRMACQWQSFITNHNAMVAKFEAAMAKMAILGHNARDLVDCSEVIPGLSLRQQNSPQARLSETSKLFAQLLHSLSYLLILPCHFRRSCATLVNHLRVCIGLMNSMLWCPYMGRFYRYCAVPVLRGSRLSKYINWAVL